MSKKGHGVTLGLLPLLSVSFFAGHPYATTSEKYYYSNSHGCPSGKTSVSPCGAGGRCCHHKLPLRGSDHSGSHPKFLIDLILEWFLFFIFLCQITGCCWIGQSDQTVCPSEFFRMVRGPVGVTRRRRSVDVDCVQKDEGIPCPIAELELRIYRLAMTTISGDAWIWVVVLRSSVWRVFTADILRWYCCLHWH